MSGGARARTQEEIRRFLAIGAVQVAELDLEGEGGSGLRPGPGSPPVTHGEVFLLVRRAGRPVGTLLTRVPDGSDPRTVLWEAARADHGTSRQRGGRTEEGGGAAPRGTVALRGAGARAPSGVPRVAAGGDG
ncbi:hypothetical protein AB8O53_27445, partial [Streptomyces pilosus]